MIRHDEDGGSYMSMHHVIVSASFCRQTAERKGSEQRQGDRPTACTSWMPSVHSYSLARRLTSSRRRARVLLTAKRSRNIVPTANEENVIKTTRPSHKRMSSMTSCATTPNLKVSRKSRIKTKSDLSEEDISCGTPAPPDAIRDQPHFPCPHKWPPPGQTKTSESGSRTGRAAESAPVFTLSQ